MEVKKGYKLTEAGIIPEDWNIKKLETVGVFSKGSGIKKDEVLSEGIPCIRYGEIYTTHHDYIRHFRSFISVEVANQSRKLKKGDLLFAGSGETADEIGKCVAFLGDEIAYAGGDIVILSQSGEDAFFLGYLLNSPAIARQKASRGQGDAVVHISAKNLSNISIPLPPTLAEQRAIATALSDADALIAALDRLIAKKKAIKQGAMQELLTGKRRLEGFEGEWEVKKLGDLLYLQGGFAFKSEKFTKSGTPIVRISNIVDGYIDLTDAVYYSENERIPTEFTIKSGDSLIAMSGATTGKVGIFKGNGIVFQNQRVGRFEVRNISVTSTEFVHQFVSSGKFKTTLENALEQGAQPNISGKQIENLEINIPVKFAEQRAIAQILTDMDAEIAALEQQRNKYKAVKQGMMQELLTGKTRLV